MERNRQRRALVLGLGASGEAAARLLRREEWSVWVVDAADATDALDTRAHALRAIGAEVTIGSTTLPAGLFDLAVISPGVPVDSPWMVELRQRGIPCLSELELGWSRHRGKTIAVTGSNGKSTAVKWITESLWAGGCTAVAAGNYGLPASRAVMEGDVEWLVLEVSSFQLETVVQFRPQVGVLLNIYPNHLDRHHDFETYRRLKWRLFESMSAQDTAVVPASLVPAARGCPAKIKTFGGCDETADYRYENGVVFHCEQPCLDVRGTFFDNSVLGLTAAAVAATVEAAGLPVECARRAALSFRPLPHRMALVAEIGGVRYVDNSKATNVAAMLASLRMIAGPVRLIAGGLAKGEDFSAAANMLCEKVRKVYLIGKAAPDMAAAWSKVVPCAQCGTLEVAVQAAREDARPGETVLLAPACASFDQYASYAARGEHFMRLVMGAGAKTLARDSGEGISAGKAT